MKVGPRNLITDVAGLRVGNAQDDALKSGCTVLVGDAPFTAAVHVMGGAPGTRETDLLAPDRLVQQVDALVLSGGSGFGLDSSSGVADGLRRMGRGFVIGAARVPIVPGAILFDLLNGGDKNWTENPYKPLGEAALKNATVEFPLGTVGAGTGATTRELKGGLGSASVVLDNGITVGALVAVNAIGSVIQQEQKHFWAAPFEVDGEFGGNGPATNVDPFQNLKPYENLTSGTNTTIAIIATDADLTQAEATRVAIAAHDGMARAIVPSHTPYDGDLVFVAATGKRPLTDKNDILQLGHAAANCLTRAIARGVFEATAAAGDTLPTWRDKW
ncbi:MAG: P1 family peptidase [Alphaproteobacteria bacterium]